MTRIACALFFTAALSMTPLAQAADIAVPSNLNFKRLQLLDKPDREHKDGKLKVYVTVKGEDVGGKLLVSSAKYLQNITVTNLRQMLLDKIGDTQRFEVFDQELSGVMDESSIIVVGQVVGATQHIENLVVARKAITRVRLSVNISDTANGKVLRAKTFTGHYGDKRGEGTVIVSTAELTSEQTQESLYKDYDRAMSDALNDVADYVESRYRPVGKITELSGDSFAMDGGYDHGFNGDDEVVVFRTQFSIVNGERVPGIMTGLARAKCPSVNDRSSTCQVVMKGSDGPIKHGDYVVVSDETLAR